MTHVLALSWPSVAIFRIDEEEEGLDLVEGIFAVRNPLVQQVLRFQLYVPAKALSLLALFPQGLQVRISLLKITLFLVAPFLRKRW